MYKKEYKKVDKKEKMIEKVVFAQY
jgi:hypothetical protein